MFNSTTGSENGTTTTAAKHGIHYHDIASGPQFFVDGVEHTADEVRDIKRALKEAEDAEGRARDRLAQVQQNLRDFTAGVRSAITELVHDGDLDKTTANEVLEGLNMDPLPTKYKATVTVEFEVEFESTENEETVESHLRDDSTFEMDGYHELDNFDVNDISVTDVDVTEDE
jgi:hypothetical protein